LARAGESHCLRAPVDRRRLSQTDGLFRRAVGSTKPLDQLLPDPPTLPIRVFDAGHTAQALD